MKCFEIAKIQIRDISDDEVVTHLTYALELIRAAKGCGDVQIWRCVEDPSSVQMLIEWDELADHEAFRQSGALEEDRARFQPILIGPSSVAHYNELAVLPRL